MHPWSLNLSTMSTLVTELAECCVQVTKLGKDEQTGHNRDVRMSTPLHGVVCKSLT